MVGFEKKKRGEVGGGLNLPRFKNIFPSLKFLKNLPFPKPTSFLKKKKKKEKV